MAKVFILCLALILVIQTLAYPIQDPQDIVSRIQENGGLLYHKVQPPSVKHASVKAQLNRLLIEINYLSSRNRDCKVFKPHKLREYDT